MKADGSLKSLLQGVSQQPVRDRLPGQCTEQINMTSDPVRGLSRRGGSDLVGVIGGNNVLAYQNIALPDGRKVLLTVRSTGILAHDYNAVSIPVVHEDNMDYYTVPDGTQWSSASYRGVTYLANNSKITAMRSDVASYPNTTTRMGIFQVLGGQYGKKYSIIIDGVVQARVGTVDGTNPAHSSYVGTNLIAEMLLWCLEHDNTDAVPSHFPAVGTANVEYYRTGYMKGTGWVNSRQEDVVLLKSPSATPFNLAITDGQGNINVKAMTDSVPDVADLPKWAPHEYVVRVAQETDPDEDLWLKFVVDDAGTAPGAGFGLAGAWYETIAPGIKLGFDANTMPRSITYEAGTLKVRKAGFLDRLVGTEVTNPQPSFIGYPINDISTFQSRLVFLAGENVVATRTKRPLDFWIGSASALVDSDPLDLTSQAAEATTMRWAVPHNKDLVVFSPVGQFVLFGRQAVTPTNAALAPTTSFEANMEAKPVPSGRNVFFATSFGRFTGIREFYTEGGTDINDTRPITQHVNRYIVGEIEHLASTSNSDILLVHTKTNKNTVYQYQFIWNDQEKVQSAWSKWVFRYDIVHSFFDQDTIYLVVEAPGASGNEHVLVRLGLDIQDEVGVDYPVHLDAKFDVTGVNTQFVVPLTMYEGEPMIVIQGEGCPHPGLPARILSQAEVIGTGWVVTLREDMEGGDIIVGLKNRAEFWPTMPRVKDGSGDVIGNARLVVAQFLIELEQTGHIIGRKISKYGTYPEVAFEGYIVNSPTTLVGHPAIADHTFKMPFAEKVQLAELALYTEQHYPMTILDVEWEGTVNKRGRRIETGE